MELEMKLYYPEARKAEDLPLKQNKALAHAVEI